MHEGDGVRELSPLDPSTKDKLRFFNMMTYMLMRSTGL
jgi:hypothetical protein